MTGIRHNLGASKVNFVYQNNQRTTTKEKTPVTPIVSVLCSTTTNKPEITKTQNPTQHENNLAVITISVDVFLIQNMSRFATQTEGMRLDLVEKPEA